MIEIGLKHTSELTVTDDVTAITIGSGDMPFLATPMMMAIELELAKYLEEEEVDKLINQFPIPADYDGVGSKGTKFVFYI